MAGPVTTRTEGAAAFDGGLSIGNGVWLLTVTGAPTNGTSGDGAGFAGKGSLLSRYDNGTLYQNTGTAASPTWTLNDVN